MKISVNDKELYTLTETQKQVIKNDIHEDDFDEDMKRRLKWILFDEKYKRCFDRLKKEWDAKLAANGVKSIPLDEEEYAQLVFSQPDYKSRKQRDLEADIK